MANIISQITPLGSTTKYSLRASAIASGTSSTAASTTIKTVSIDNFQLVTGAVVLVKFNNTNTAAVSSLQLNVNGTGPKDIKYKYNADTLSSLPEEGYLKANVPYLFYYDGTNWIADIHYDTNSGGTVTGITISGTSPISASGTISSSGTITISHANSGVTAQNTQSLYPFKVNATGHITSVGSAVTIPTAGSSATAVSTTSSAGTSTQWSKSDHVHSLSAATVTSALGYTPYNSTNPDGYITANDVPKENFIVTVTLTSLTGGTSDKTSDEIAAAAAAGKLPVVVTQYYNALLVAPLSWIKISSDPLESNIAYFTYEDQSNEDIPYATMQIWNHSVVLGFRSQYLTEITSTEVTGALGYTPYDSSNPSGYITSAAVPTAGTTVTAVSTTSAVGTSTNYARQDHVHAITVTTGDANGQIKIADTNVDVKGLASAAYTESTAYSASTHVHGNVGNTGLMTATVTASTSDRIVLTDQSNSYKIVSADMSAATSTMLNSLGEGTSPAQMNDYIIAQYAGGGTTTKTYHRRKLSNLLTATNINTGLGTTPVARATGDSDGNNIINTYATKTELSSLISSADAMVLKGIVGSGSGMISLPTSPREAGWTYRVGTAGTYAGKACEVGDFIICVKDVASGGTTSNNDFVVIQANVDGPVYTGSNTFTDGALIAADGTSGKVKTVSIPEVTVKSVATFSGGVAASLTTSTYTIPNVTAAGSAASLTTSTYTINGINNPGSSFTATVSGQVLYLTSGQSLTTSTYTIKGVNVWTAGSAPTIGTAFTVKGVNVFTPNTIASLTTSDVSVMGPIGETLPV